MKHTDSARVRLHRLTCLDPARRLKQRVLLWLRRLWGWSFVGWLLRRKLRATGTVQAGPFQGMRFPTSSTWSGLESKLLGVYEAELYPTLESWRKLSFTHIIDVGSADGYYAVGCALLWPDAKITAYESEPSGQALVRSFAALNGVSDRVECRGHCDPSELRRMLTSVSSGMLIMDVEGYEDVLLDLATVQQLRRFYVLVELHDLRVQCLGEKLAALFQDSHMLEEIWTRPRQVSDFWFPRSEALRRLLLRHLRALGDEHRGAPMRWFVLEPKAFTAMDGRGSEHVPASL